MASDPRPTNMQEGAEIDEAPVPTNAEDRKTAAAMSTLEGRGDDDEGKGGKDVDTEALGKAMKNLNVQQLSSKQVEKKVKVEAADVALLVEQLELSKFKATELLKSHEGDAVRAMVAFVTATT